MTADDDKAPQRPRSGAVGCRGIAGPPHGDGCGFSYAFRIDAMAIAVGPSFSLSCPAAVSLALWERHVLLPAARRHLARPIARIEHFGSHACRNRYGREGGTRSRHATADAVDIAGVSAHADHLHLDRGSGRLCR